MACVLFAAVLAGGCQDYNIPITPTGGGGSGGGSSGLFIQLDPAGTVLVDVGKTRHVTATLTNDPNHMGVTWILTGPGSLSNISTTSVTYTAPTALDVPATITATSIADTTQVATETMYSVPLPTIPMVTLATGTVGAAYSSAISGVNGSPPYNWSVSSGSLPPGLSLSVASFTSVVLQGTPTAAGTFNFTIQLADASSSVASQPESVVVNAGMSPGMISKLATLGGGGVNNLQLQGSYAFRFGGFGPHGMTVSAGSFTADGNGKISGGMMDQIGAANARTGLAFSGTYAVGANHLGEMTLNLPNGQTGIYALAVSSSGNARFIEFDDDQSVTATSKGTHGSGEMKRQDAKSLGTLNAAGNYVFELTGVDSQGARVALAGEFSATDSGALSQGTADANDNGRVTAQVGFAGNHIVAATGAGNATLNVPGFGVVHLNLYGVSADEEFGVGTDGSGQMVLTGSVLRQKGGPFTNASLAGNLDFQTTGFANGGSLMTFGMISADGRGTATVSAAQMTGDGAAAVDATHSMSVSAAGRVALGSQQDSQIIYLVDVNEGFVLGPDAEVTTGWIQPHATGAITAASFNGMLEGASVVPDSPGVTESVISLNFDGNGNVTGVGASSGPQGSSMLPAQQGTYGMGAGDIFLSVTWGLQNPQPMLIVSPSKLIVVPSGASFAPIVMEK
ncbi:MAG TPA: Ig domain-containing protein [Candidatus Acidoferrales bacterium]|nr:Ig domain-containing protein [Candidatus Acidoferrales bacterium]